MWHKIIHSLTNTCGVVWVKLVTLIANTFIRRWNSANAILCAIICHTILTFRGIWKWICEVNYNELGIIITNKLNSQKITLISLLAIELNQLNSQLVYYSCIYHWKDPPKPYIPQIVMFVVLSAFPKMLDTSQVTVIDLVSELKSDSKTVSFNCRILLLDICICSISVLLEASILSTVKMNTGSGSGSLPSKHSKVMLGNNESTSSRQKSIPMV